MALPLAAVALAGCSGNKTAKHTENTPSPLSTAAHASFVSATANYDNYRKDHKCDGATPRPCAEPLYKEPSPHVPVLSTEVINALNADGTAIAWPHEGDLLKVVCQVQGKEVKYYYSPATNVMDVVEAPADSSHINQDALSSLLEMHPDWKPEYGAGHSIDRFLMPDGQEGHAYAYATGASIAGGKVFPQLGPCNSEENPAGAPPVQ